jgi:hypothetical protein|tara:strand:- start:4602 stop:4991 length:390 start_codon:yes stop_codon:yes gene_type:complete
MGILKELFGTSELIEEIGEIADDLITTKEEKLILKQQIEEKILEYESKMQQEISERWKADMASDSKLAKNVRPMVLIFLVVSTMILVFIDAGTIKFHVESNWVSLLELVLIAVIGSYFGGRSLEKIKRK